MKLETLGAWFKKQVGGDMRGCSFKSLEEDKPQTTVPCFIIREADAFTAIWDNGDWLVLRVTGEHDRTPSQTNDLWCSWPWLLGFLPLDG